MSEKMISEREAVMRERKAYENGMVRGTAREFTNIIRVQEAAEAAYPLPPIELGRFAGRDYRLREGVLEYATKLRRTFTPHPTTEPNWDRASLQPEDVLILAAELEKIRDAD